MSTPAPVLEERPSLAATVIATARRWAGRAGEAAVWLAVAAVALVLVGALIVPWLRLLAAGLVLLAVGYGVGRLHGEHQMSERIRYVRAENESLKRANYLAAATLQEIREREGRS